MLYYCVFCVFFTLEHIYYLCVYMFVCSILGCTHINMTPAVAHTDHFVCIVFSVLLTCVPSFTAAHLLCCSLCFQFECPIYLFHEYVMLCSTPWCIVLTMVIILINTYSQYGLRCETSVT